MTEDLSTAQRLQMAAMTTDALSNLLERSKHLCRSDWNDTNANAVPAYGDHEKLMRQAVQLTVATLTETIQALTPALKAEAEGPGNVDEALAGLVHATAARL